MLLVKAPAVTFLHPGLVFLNTPGFVPILEKWLVGFRPNAQITSDQDSLDYQRVSVAFSFCLATAFWTSTEKLDSTWKHLSAAKFQLVKDFNDSGCPLWIPILIQIFSWSWKTSLTFLEWLLLRQRCYPKQLLLCQLMSLVHIFLWCTYF